MQRIIVKNFGPLKDIDLEIKDFMVFIGPNASGKSTLAKLIYAFQHFPIFLHSFFLQKYNTVDFNNKEKLYADFSRDFLPLVFNENLLIEYFINKNHKLTLSYSPNTKQTFNYLIEDNFGAFYQNIPSGSTPNGRNEDFQAGLALFARILRNHIETFFQTSLRQDFFIPERKVIIDKENVVTRSFYNLVFYAKNNFAIGKPLVKNEVIFSKILKGLPEDINREDFGLLTENRTYVPFELLSSGQQENYWLLLSLVYLKETFSPSNLFIEEPENHLFPEAQKDILEFLVEFFNHFDLKLLITTHSHYIIGVINVLINAHRIGQTHPDKVEKVITKDFWLDKDRVFIGRLKDGELKSVYSEEAEIFEHEELTQTSGILNEEYDQLLDIEFESANDK